MRIPRVPTLALAAFAVVIVALMLKVRDGAAIGRGSGPSAEAKAGPRAIVPCSPAAADWLSALVDPARVAAVPSQVEKYSTMRLDPGTWKDHPRFRRVDAENVLAYTPDLVLVSPITEPSTVERMREVGLVVLVVDEPTTWAGLLETGKSVAEATGTQSRWEVFRSELVARREKLRANAPAIPLRLLPYGNYGADSFTAGKGSTLDLAILLSGHRNHARDLGIGPSAAISAEAMLASPFDAFVVAGSKTRSQSAAALRGSPLLQALAPVAKAQIIYIGDALYASGSFTILDAAEQIAAQAKALKGPAASPAAVDRR